MLSSMGLMTACGGNTESEAPVVAAPTGIYTGIENDGVAEFKGIRYGNFEPFKPATDVTTTEADAIEAKEVTLAAHSYINS